MTNETSLGNKIIIFALANSITFGNLNMEEANDYIAAKLSQDSEVKDRQLSPVESSTHQGNPDIEIFKENLKDDDSISDEMIEFISNLSQNQKDIDPDIQTIVEEGIWDLI